MHFCGEFREILPRKTRRPKRANIRTHGRAGNRMDLDAALLKHLEDAHMSQTARTSRGKCEAEFRLPRFMQRPIRPLWGWVAFEYA